MYQKIQFSMVFILDGNLEICALKENFLLFDLFKAYNFIEGSHKYDFFFLYACATYSELPYNISIMSFSALHMDFHRSKVIDK